MQPFNFIAKMLTIQLMRRLLYFLGILLFISSCTRVPDSECCVSELIGERVGKMVQWNEDCNIQEFLEQELTVDAAVQLALLNNPHIQATFEEVGISQADLVDAGLMSNPVFDLFIRYPNKKHFVADIEYSITASFIDLFLIPLRRKVALADLEKVTLLVTNKILDLAFDVEQTYYQLQGARQEIEYTESIAELLNIHSEIVLRQENIHNVNQLQLQQIQAQSLSAELEIVRVQNEIVHLKEKLNKLLGLCENRQLFIPDTFPEVDYEGLPLDRLECVAFQERLDLQAARFEVLRLSRSLGIKQWWVYTEGRIGIGGERDADGLNTLGPAFSGAIPIFNYGQAARMRLRAQLRQAQDRLESLEIQVLSEVREAHQLLMNHLRVIQEYREQIFPLQDQILQSSEALYNVMGLGVDRLLESKWQEQLAHKNYVTSLRNFWMARVQLDRALGGKLYKIYCEEP